MRILTLCTGNVARSVMLGYMLTTLAEAEGVSWQVRTAGTLCVEGSAMSSRTLAALTKIDELGEHHYQAHRSHQVDADDVAWADIILTSEADHVSYMRRQFPDAISTTVQLHQFVRFAELDGPLDERLATVIELGPDERFDVRDPAGGDQATYDACAQQLWELAQAFTTLVTATD